MRSKSGEMNGSGGSNNGEVSPPNGNGSQHQHHERNGHGHINGHSNYYHPPQFDPKDTNIKVVIRNGHIVEGEETLPRKSRSSSSRSNYNNKTGNYIYYPHTHTVHKDCSRNTYLLYTSTFYTTARV